MADLIRFRRGDAARWLEVDPVLAQGEPGFESDTGGYKIGDGTSAWSRLPYLGTGSDTTRTGSAPVGQGELVSNVLDPRFGARGDGIADDTDAIRRAIAATPAGGTCYLPPGTYVVSGDGPGILLGVDGLTLAGAGAGLTTLRVGPGTGAGSVLDLSGCTDVHVRDLMFDGMSSTTTKCGVQARTRGGQRNIRVERCRFLSFMPGDSTATSAAVYVWTSDGVHVVGNEFVSCGRAVTIDQPDGVAEVVGNRIVSSDPGIMSTGIMVRRASGSSESKVRVHGNAIAGANRDPARQGAEGHGITVFRSRDVHVTDNHCLANGRGILVSNGGFGAIVQGNTCTANSDAGIRVEPEITERITSIGSAAPRGVTVIGNVCRDNAGIGALSGANSGIGIAMSYAAGSVVSGNVVHDNTGDGIFCDSDRVAIVGNVVYNNFRGFTQDPTTGRRGGIRVIVGTGCTIVANQCFDSQASKTQHYGISLSSTGVGHQVHGNSLAGNAVGEIWGADKTREGFFGATPIARPAGPGTATGPDAAVINDLVQSLRDLGLLA